MTPINLIGIVLRTNSVIDLGEHHGYQDHPCSRLDHRLHSPSRQAARPCSRPGVLAWTLRHLWGGGSDPEERATSDPRWCERGSRVVMRQFDYLHCRSGRYLTRCLIRVLQTLFIIALIGLATSVIYLVNNAGFVGINHLLY